MPTVRLAVFIRAPKGTDLSAVALDVQEAVQRLDWDYDVEVQSDGVEDDPEDPGDEDEDDLLDLSADLAEAQLLQAKGLL